MNWISRFTDRLLAGPVDRRVEAALAQARSAASVDARVDQLVTERVEALREAAGQSLDTTGWRRLTDKRRDLDPVTQDRAREIAYYLWMHNPLARRIVEIIGEWVVGEGVTFHCPHPKTREFIERHWRRRANGWERKLRRRVRELYLFGDQTWPAFVNPYDAILSLGTIDPSQVREVILDPHNSEVPIGLITKSTMTMAERRIRTVLLQEDLDSLSPAAAAERERFADGEAFFFAVDNLSTMSRGCSVLFALADSVDGYEQLLFALLQKEMAGAHVLWDVELQGADEAKVQKRATEIQPPKPFTVRVHNDKEKWTAVAPDVKSGESGALRVQRNHVLGGGAMPEHWFGGGGDVNRATAAEMGLPTEKAMAARQRDVRAVLEDVLLAQIERGIQLGVLRDEADAREVSVNMPELSSRDHSRITASFQQLASAFAVARSEGWVSDEVASRTLGSLIGQMGIEVNPEEMLEQARKQRGKTLADEASRALEDREDAA